MRKQQYIATVACLVAGVIGFVSVYATDKGKERREAEQEIAAQTQQEAPASYEVKPEISVEDATKKAEEQALKLAEQEKIKQEETQQEEEKKQDEEKTVETAATVTQHFDKSSAVWPIEGRCSAGLQHGFHHLFSNVRAVSLQSGHGDQWQCQ